jgi:hypothetical protein
MTSRFKIEEVIIVERKVYIFTSYIGGSKSFMLDDSSTLNGVPIEMWIDIPRRVDFEGKPKEDYYVFALKDKGDKDKFKVNHIVNLNHPE